MNKYIHVKINKKVLMAIIVVAVAVCFFAFGHKVGASTSAPGSVGDPLITQSYLAEELKNVQGAYYKKVSVKKGATLSAESGSVMVLYSGDAKVSSGSELVNMTEGKKITAGDKVLLYESLLTPKDGCGLTAASDCIVYFMGELKNE